MQYLAETQGHGQQTEGGMEGGLAETQGHGQQTERGGVEGGLADTS